MLEASVETDLRDGTKERGGIAVKLNPLGYVGIPDRLVILPGHMRLVELKRPRGGRLSKMQLYWHNWLMDIGHRVEVLWSKEDVADFFRRYDGGEMGQ